MCGAPEYSVLTGPHIHFFSSQIFEFLMTSGTLLNQNNRDRDGLSLQRMETSTYVLYEDICA